MIKLNPFYIEKVKALAAQVGRFTAASGIEKEDLEQEGYVAIMEYPNSALRNREAAWEFLEPAIRKTMMAYVNGSLFRRGKIISLDAINEDLNDDEGGDLLDFMEVEQTGNELRTFVPSDPGGRWDLIQECQKKLEDMNRCGKASITGIKKNGPARYEAKLSLRGSTFKLGEFKTMVLAQKEQRAAIKVIEKQCYPLNPAAVNQARYGRKDRVNNGAHAGGDTFLASRKTNVEFWIACAKDANPGTSALPSFFYGDPLATLIFLEHIWLDRRSVSDHAYSLQARDQQFYTSTRWKDLRAA